MIEKGRIVEQGDHDTLMRARGTYFELYTSQFAFEKQEEILASEA